MGKVCVLDSSVEEKMSSRLILQHSLLYRDSQQSEKLDPEHIQHCIHAETPHKTSHLPAGIMYIHRAHIIQRKGIMFLGNTLLPFLGKWCDYS